jgi:hypothetical protein
MALYRIAFAEQHGYRIQTRIRANVSADHVALAVLKIWGESCYWAWLPGSTTEGRVYERLGVSPDVDDIPRTSVATATVQRAPARRRGMSTA